MENRGAAGLRRSAIAERLRLRQEWSALKELNEKPTKLSHKNVLTKKQQNTNSTNRIFKETTKTRTRRAPDKENSQNNPQWIDTSDILRGVVVLVDVGSESRALALRAALSALGATVMPAWSPLVTHLVWSQGGCSSIRARARALACHVVSPLWVEGCANGRRLPERLFPAPPRPSDLPSPATLKRMLIRADRENISLANLLSDSPEGAKRLRISDETSQNTSHDTSREKSTDKSCDTPGEEVRVNTAPRRPPKITSPEQQTKSRRKLFTNKEPDGTTDAESEEDRTPAPKQKKMTPRQKKELATAERMARRLLARTPATRQRDQEKVVRIVVTGMSRTERRIITRAIKHLQGVVQSKVDKKTDYIVMGSCSNQCPESLLADMFTRQLNIRQEDRGQDMNISGVCEIKKVCNIESDKVRLDIQNVTLNCMSMLNREVDKTVPNIDLSGAVYLSPEKPRTVNALLGAVRGCKVVKTTWVMDSLKQNSWLHHIGHEVKHLMKISQKARVERSALGRMKQEYAYNVFRGMKVHLTADAEQREGVAQLLKMCGAVITDKLPCREHVAKQVGRLGTTQIGGLSQYGGQQDGGIQDGADIAIGVNKGEICSRWVFDSVAASRMRTTRRYIN